MVEQDFGVLVLSLRDVSEHAFEASQSAICFKELTCQMLGYGEVDPVAPDSWLNAKDRHARSCVLGVVSQVDGQLCQVVDE